MLTFLYKNKIKEAISITESEKNTYTGWGTSALCDDNLNSAFRGDVHLTNPSIGTTSILFNFGSAVYMDSVAGVFNLTVVGTCWLEAGVTSSCGNFTTGIPIDGLGTAYKYFGNQGYQYWKINMKGATGESMHQINELFLGKRLTINEMPSFPLSNSKEADMVELVSERGQKWAYFNYERENWIFNFEGVSNTTENALYNMYKYTRKDTTPFWMNLDINNSNNLRFIRFKDKAFLSTEVTKNIFDITCEVESEI